MVNIIWRNRAKKFIDNPLAIIPFLKKKLFYNYIADKQIIKYKDCKYLNYTETVNEIITNNRSIIRFGDELFDMLQGIGLYYGNWHQKYDPDLAKRLREVLKSNDSRILLCFNFELILKSRKEFKEEGIPEQYQFWTNSKMFLKNYLHPGRLYGSALSFNTKYNPDLNSNELKQFLEKKNVVIVTSNTERFKDIKLGKTTAFIDCPTSDAWKQYQLIYDRVIAVVEDNGYAKENVLFLVSLASTAKILVFDLAKNGYVAWDTGQFFDLAAKKIKEISS